MSQSTAHRSLFCLAMAATLLLASCSSSSTDSEGGGKGSGADSQTAGGSSDQGTPTNSFIGSRAAALNIEHWVSDGNGQFPHVTEFEEGKVYIVEFWATWCGPCVASMPHLASLQQQYADSGVQLISVSREPLETVQQFLKRPVRGQEDQTYGELTSVYSLTTDPDASVHEDYMTAANQSGIPTAFIVGKTGLIEWVGHPAAMDGPLAAVVNDSWDRSLFAAQFETINADKKLMAELNQLVQAQKFDEALTKIDSRITEAKSDRGNWLKTKLQILGLAQKADGLSDLVREIFREDPTPSTANQVAWMTYQIHSQGAKVDEATLRECLQAAKTAASQQQGEMKAGVLDTVAHLQATLGQLDEAIATQEQAASLSKAPEIKQYLDQLKAEK